MTRLRTLWTELVDGFWFVPAAVALAYALVALVLVRLDRETSLGDHELTFGGDADAARDVLTTIAASLITVAGVAFSLTVVVLTLVSSQFSSRAVQTLLADRVTQVIAGSLVGIFAYCLLVLRVIRNDEGSQGEFVPTGSVTVAVGLALVGLALLVAFIHRQAMSIQPEHIGARITRTTMKVLDGVLSEPYEGDDETEARALVRGWSEEGPEGVVLARRSGFLREVDLSEIAVTFAEGSRIHVCVCPGDFVTPQTSLVLAWPKSSLDEETADTVRDALAIDDARGIAADAIYGVRQLADVAVKALSPGIHDPTTADTCIAYLGAILERIAACQLPAAIHRDVASGVQLVARRQSFADYVEVAFAEIARYGSDNARVVVSVLERMAQVARVAHAGGARERIASIEELGRMVHDLGIQDARVDRDRAAIREAFTKLTRVATNHTP